MSNMLLHDVLDSGVLEGLLEPLLTFGSDSLAHEVDKFVLDGVKNSSNSSLSNPGSQLKRNDSSLLIFFVLALGDFMLRDILAHDPVVELEGAFVGHLVVELSALRLDDVTLGRAGDVGKPVLLGLHGVVLEDLLVVKGSVLLFDQSLRG